MTNTENQSEKHIRPWGYYTNISQGNGFLVKIINVNPGGVLSVQSHEHRNEHWFIIEGTAMVLLENKEFELNKGECIDIPRKAIHSVKNASETALKIIEIQTGDILSEEDIIRYKDIYGRV